MDYRNKCGNDKIPMQAERTHTAAAPKQNPGFKIRTVSPSADMAGAATGPTLTRTLIRGLRGAKVSSHPKPNAGAAKYPTWLGTSSGGERLFWRVSFLTGSTLS